MQRFASWALRITIGEHFVILLRSALPLGFVVRPKNELGNRLRIILMWQIGVDIPILAAN